MPIGLRAKDISGAKSFENSRTYGRRLNNRARAMVDRTLDRHTIGDWKERKGTSGRNFLDQLAHEILENPLSTVMWLNDHTPCDEGTAPASNPLIMNNIGALYLTAMQRANEQQEVKTIEPDPDKVW